MKYTNEQQRLRPSLMDQFGKVIKSRLGLLRPEACKMPQHVLSAIKSCNLQSQSQVDEEIWPQVPQHVEKPPLFPTRDRLLSLSLIGNDKKHVQPPVQ